MALLEAYDMIIRGNMGGESSFKGCLVIEFGGWNFLVEAGLMANS